jgi:hypothetical protein
MKSRHLASALFLLLATTSSAWAASTPEQAADLVKTFETYLGKKPGVITVVPAGEGFDVSLDVTPYLKDISQAGFTAAIDPYRFKITALEPGKWAFSQTGPYKATASVPGTMNFDLSIGDMQMEGTYDSNLFVFLDSKYTLTNIKTSQTNSDPESKIVTSSSSVIEALNGTSASKDVGNGLADSEGVVTFTNATTASKIEVPPELAAMMPNLNYTGTTTKGEYVTKITSLAARPIMELVAWGLANSSKELALKNQAELKEKMTAALPLFGSLDTVSTFDNLVIDSGYGQFKMDQAAVNVALNGAVKEGRFAEGINFTGFKMPDNLLPPWSAGLVPKTLKIGFDASGFDTETPVRKFITEMDLNNPDMVPPGSEAAYLAAFSPTNSMQLTLPSGEISSDVYSITFDSTSTINFAGLPQVNAQVRMKGLDAVIAQLQQAAADPMAQQAMAMLFAAKGVSKADGDGVIWDISVSPDGKALVNGTDLSAMMGAIAPPPPAPAQ